MNPRLADNSFDPALIRLRPSVIADEDLLLALYTSSRLDEMAQFGWDQLMRDAFIKMQFTAQRQHYAMAYPGSYNQIVLLAEKPIGRMLVDKSGLDFVLVDIVLLPEFQNAGIGGRLIKELLRDAASLSKSVRLHVVKNNPAARLYGRLGFSPVRDDGVYFEMLWLPPSSG